MSEQSDLIKKMEEMIKNPTISEKMRKVFQERLEKLKNVDDNSTNYKQTNLNSSTQSGMTLFGQFRAKKERVAGSNGPSSFCIRVINNKKMNYWESESDYGEKIKMRELESHIAEQTEKLNKGKEEGDKETYTVVDNYQHEFDFSTIDNNEEEILVLKVRGKSSAAKSSFGEKPIVRFMVIRNTNELWISVFTDKIQVQNGDYVLVKGFLANDYENSSRLNCKMVTKSKFDPDVLSKEIFELNIDLYPRFLSSYREIDEQPLSGDEKTARSRRLSPELEKFLATPIQMCSWPTRSEEENLKARSVIFDTPTLTSFSYEKSSSSDNSKKIKINQLVLQQKVAISDVDEGSKNVLLNFKINSTHCTKLIGITNTNTFKPIAENHVPKMKFAFFVEPNHQGTCALEINNPSLKDPIFAEFHHAIECLAGASTHIMSDIIYYLLEKSIRLDFGTVKKLMGTALDYEYEDPEKNPNIYNVHKKLVNLNEYKGSLNDFAADYEFAILTTDKPFAMQNLLTRYPDPKERMAKAIQDLLGHSKAEVAILAKCEKNSLTSPYVIFAIQQSVVDACKKNEALFSMSKYYEKIESKQEKYGVPETPAADKSEHQNSSTANNSTSNKRKLDDEKQGEQNNDGDTNTNDEKKTDDSDENDKKKKSDSKSKKGGAGGASKESATIKIDKKTTKEDKVEEPASKKSKTAATSKKNQKKDGDDGDGDEENASKMKIDEKVETPKKNDDEDGKKEGDDASNGDNNKKNTDENEEEGGKSEESVKNKKKSSTASKSSSKKPVSKPKEESEDEDEDEDDEDEENSD